MSSLIKICLLSLSLLTPLTVLATDTFSLLPGEQSTVRVDQYQIFPKNRFGNGLYHQKKLLVIYPNRQIIDVMEIINADSLVYLYEDEQQKLALGLYDFSGKRQAKIKRIDDEFYETWNYKLGINAIFRIKGNKVKRIFEKLRTATGVTPSRDHIAFYHIITNEQVIEGDREFRVFTFRIHILKRSEERPITLKLDIRDTRSILKLSWIDEKTLRYQLEDETEEDINLSLLLPKYF